MTSSAPPNPNPAPVPVPTPTPPANGAASPPKDQQQQQQQGGQEGAAAGEAAEVVDGGGAEATEAGVAAAGDAMEVDGVVGGDAETGGVAGGGGGPGGGAQQPSPATVFRIRLKQPPASLRHKMRVPELCRNFSAVAWCGKLNAIACASETCARIPSSNSSPPFWIPIHMLNPERPTECSVFNVKADSPRDFIQFIEWSPRSCPRALLVANFHGRITIWTQPSKSNLLLILSIVCCGEGSCQSCS